MRRKTFFDVTNPTFLPIKLSLTNVRRIYKFRAKVEIGLHETFNDEGCYIKHSTKFENNTIYVTYLPPLQLNS